MRTSLLMAVAYCTAALAAAQTSTPPPPPSTPPVVVSPQRGQPPPTTQTPAPTPPTQPPGRQVPASSLRNVRLDISITDTGGADGATKKAVTLLVRSGRGGQVRSTGIRGIINVDAMPNELSDGRVEVSLTLEYLPEGQQQPIGKLTESLTVILENGKPLVVTQSADPQSDRRVTVELTATLLK